MLLLDIGRTPRLVQSMIDPTITPPPRFRWLAELRGVAILALLIGGGQSLAAQPFYIPSGSMMPTLLVGDRLVVSKWPYGWSYASPVLHPLPYVPGRLFGRLPDRGDIVIVTPPDAARRGEVLIKRVIGLPGDTVRMAAGRLWLNGRPVATRDLGYRAMPVDGNFRCDAAARTAGKDGDADCRLHIIRETLPGGRSYDTIDYGWSEGDDFAAYTVPAGHIFLMGDNRDRSADSRVPVEMKGLGGAVPLENIGGRAEFVTFSLNGNATWNPLTWPAAFRRGRAGTSLHPSDVP